MSSPTSETSSTATAGPVGLAGRYVGKVVIVTGGSKGIGEGCVRVFMAAGANVVFCARNVKEVSNITLNCKSCNLHLKSWSIFIVCFNFFTLTRAFQHYTSKMKTVNSKLETFSSPFKSTDQLLYIARLISQFSAGICLSLRLNLCFGFFY